MYVQRTQCSQRTQCIFNVKNLPKEKKTFPNIISAY